MSQNNIAIIGITSWGVTLSNLFLKNGLNVTLMTRSDKESTSIKKSRKLPHNTDYIINEQIIISNNYEKVISNSKIIILAVPSTSINKNVDRIKKYINDQNIIMSAIKGFDPITKQTISNYILNNVNISKENIGVLSGPNISKEIYQGLPSSTVIGLEKKYENYVRNTLNSNIFRVYSTNDILGVELGGAIKNIMAIGAGVIDEFKLGSNAMSSYITRSLYEMKKIGKAMGAKESTFNGNSGMGDLITTCFNKSSRNHQLGVSLAKGVSLNEAEQKINGVIEGIHTTKILCEIISDKKIETPIIDQINNVLFFGKDPKLAIKDLLNRKDVKE